MAYATDTNGSERFTMRVRQLATDTELPDVIEKTQGGAVWSADGAGFFYTLVNDNWRPYVVKYHRLGSDPAADATIYEESDTGFFVSVGLTQSRAFHNGSVFSPSPSCARGAASAAPQRARGTQSLP